MGRRVSGIFVTVVAAAIMCMALLSASCDDTPKRHTFDVPDQVAPEKFDVAVVWHPHMGSMLVAAGGYGVPIDVDGFSVMTTNPGGVRGYHCEIHMLAPPDLSEATQLLLGHEFAHCLYGRYHR
jgi:hypothetical protein